MLFKFFSVSLSALVVVLLIIASSCDKSGPIVSKNCPDGAEMVNGLCQCKSGYYSFNNVCIPVDQNTYLGINPSCNCYDTLLFGFVSSNGVDGDFQMKIKSGNGVVGSFQTNIFHYQLSDGDSIWTPELGYKCEINGKATYPAIYGKKLPDGSWKLDLKFHDPNAILTVLDSCTIVAKHL